MFIRSVLTLSLFSCIILTSASPLLPVNDEIDMNERNFDMTTDPLVAVRRGTSDGFVTELVKKMVTSEEYMRSLLEREPRRKKGKKQAKKAAKKAARKKQKVAAKKQIIANKVAQNKAKGRVAQKNVVAKGKKKSDGSSLHAPSFITSTVIFTKLVAVLVIGGTWMLL